MRSSLFFGFVGILVLLAACSSSEGSDESSPTASAMATAPNPVDTALAAGAPLKEIRVSARRFEFSPASFTVNQGDVVKLIMYSEDVNHGIAIPHYRINLGVPAGEERNITFLADQQGEFPFYCSVFCGSGHGQMRGLLVVQ